MHAPSLSSFNPIYEIICVNFKLGVTRERHVPNLIRLALGRIQILFYFIN